MNGTLILLLILATIGAGIVFMGIGGFGSGYYSDFDMSGISAMEDGEVVAGDVVAVPCIVNPIKILITGDAGVGKTAVHHKYTEQLNGTGGYKIIEFGEHKTKHKEFLGGIYQCNLDIEIWDTVGQSSPFEIQPEEYENVDAFIIIYDYSNPTTSKHWKTSIESHQANSPVILEVGNVFADRSPGVMIPDSNGKLLVNAASGQGIGYMFTEVIRAAVNHKEMQLLNTAKILGQPVQQM